MLKIVISLFFVFSLLWFIWRLGSRRYVIPCPAWLSWFVEMDNPFTKVNRAKTIIKYLNLKKGMIVLDVGCGPGRLTIPIAQIVEDTGQVVAMDIQQAMLNKVEQKAKKLDLNNITLLHSGIGLGGSKLEKNEFDRVLLVTVLGEIPNQKKALQEIFDTMKDGAILSITEIIFDPHFQRRSVITKLAQSVGFKEKAFFGNFFAYTLHLEK